MKLQIIPRRNWLLVMLCAVSLLPAVDAQPAAPADVVVAADGSEKFRTIREAIDAAPPMLRDSGRRWTILVKPGIYRELVYVPRERRFVTLMGEDAAKTILTYDLYASLPGPDDKPMGVSRTPTLVIEADDFTVENLTIENSAVARGPAVAVKLDGDRIVLRRCHLVGWQDTVLSNRGRHYFEACHVEGSIDLIRGGGTAYFERCRIRSAGPGAITAATTPAQQAFGFVFSQCAISGANPDVRAFLGRPGRDTAKVVFLHTEMAEVVRPAGWDNGKRPMAEKTAFFAEYGTTGPGGSAERSGWAKVLTAAEAEEYTRARVLAGADGWDPTQVAKPRRKK